MADFISSISRLLAQENLNVIRANVKTAAFNIQSRTLVLPQWQNLSLEVETLMALHEVGHALFSDENIIKALQDKVLDFPNAHAYLNIVEDIRIEKLVKHMYPGCRKDFATGYKHLSDLDFFGIRDKAVYALPFPDRLNLHFKLGKSEKIPFNRDEMSFLPRLEKMTTVQEAIELTQEIYDFCKSHTHFEGDLSLEDGDAGSTDDFEDLSEWSEYREIEDNHQASSGDELPPVPSTNSNLENNLEASTDSRDLFAYWQITPFSWDPVVPFKTVITKMDNVNHKFYGRYLEKEFLDNFKSECNNNVSYLIKEFEMKKAASNYKRTQISKSGQINANKLFAYQIKDDIFKQIQQVKDGKNHGMLFLLDWSGSMDNVMPDVIKQLIYLTTFCRRAQIPFQVFAFAGTLPDAGHDYQRDHDEDEETGPGVINANWSRVSLIELFSHKMTSAEFSTMCNYLLTNRLKWVYEMGSTPLADSLLYMYDYVGKFQQQSNIEKLSLVILSDGASHPFNSTSRIGISRKHFIVNDETKKNYALNSDGAFQTRTMLQMIQDRYNCKVLGFFLVRDRKFDLIWAISTIYPGLSPREKQEMLDKLRSDIRSDGVHAAIDLPGWDEMYVMATSTLAQQENTFKVDGQCTATAIARQFTKHLKKPRNSRVILNKFIAQIV